MSCLRGPRDGTTRSQVRVCCGSSIPSLTLYPSHLRCVHSSRKPTTGSSGFTHKTDRLAAMGGSHVPPLHTHYSMWYLIALGSNVCAHRGGANLKQLNFNMPAQNHSSMPLTTNTVTAIYSNSPSLVLRLRACHRLPIYPDCPTTLKIQAQIHLNREFRPNLSTLK
jgi:hypothetical protein